MNRVIGFHEYVMASCAIIAFVPPLCLYLFDCEPLRRIVCFSELSGALSHEVRISDFVRQCACFISRFIS